MLVIGAVLLAAALGGAVWKTRGDLRPLPGTLTFDASNLRKVQILDRNGRSLTITYQNRWNVHDHIPLHGIPLFLQQAFILSEDQRFYRHKGVDWKARFQALFQNIRALGAVRGASTITEQVVRILHPRPRTVWSRWIEGIEAHRLEKMFSKADILEFYLNQVPYSGQRRGVVQAARYCFDRDLDTLSQKEILALVVLVRAPGRLDLHRSVDEIGPPLRQLARRLLAKGLIDREQYAQILEEPFQIQSAELSIRASHFVHYIYESELSPVLHIQGRLYTTLDSCLQHKIQSILDNRLRNLGHVGIENGAVLVVDHTTDDVLAWVNAGIPSEDVPGSWIDAVTTPRQPGSTLKPFLYALALEEGWTAATLVNDTPLAEPVGLGLHAYQNYSRTHYGPMRVRDALGNSLNIPAVRTIQFVGADRFLQCLNALGIKSLQAHPDYYGDGLALGNGEVTLLEIVRAYAVLARQGNYRPLKLLTNDDLTREPTRRVFSKEVSSLISNILSDPDARKLEFGRGSLLRFPVQTAVKTGTSSDYRDAWVVGFNDRYTVGVWMGNLDHTPTDGITGAGGPALVLRSVFAELNRHRDTNPLYLNPRLVEVEICRDTGLMADGSCPRLSEWFIPGTEPGPLDHAEATTNPIRLSRPTHGLQLATDPRIPDDQEAFPFELTGLPEGGIVDWFVDDRLLETSRSAHFLWPLERGVHAVRARIRFNESTQCLEIPPVSFTVK